MFDFKLHVDESAWALLRLHISYQMRFAGSGHTNSEGMTPRSLLELIRESGEWIRRAASEDLVKSLQASFDSIPALRASVKHPCFTSDSNYLLSHCLS